jgi:membrane protease YdiL (CAAX protease family)
MTADVSPERRSWWTALSGIAIVRLLGMAAMMLAAYIGCQLAVILAFRAAPKASTDLITMIGQAVSALFMIVLYSGLVRLFEQRRAREARLGFGWALFGVILGFALFCLVYAVFLGLGIVNWRGLVSYEGVAPVLTMAVFTSVAEELIFRGVVFRVVEDSLGTALAVLISAGLFGLLHAMNPGATPVSTAAIALEAGVLLALSYAWSRNLWLPIGLHFGWNFTEGGVFGAAVSGGGHFHGLVSAPISTTAPDLLTGGAFGPEASLVAVGVSLAASLVLALVTVRAGQWRSLRFRMSL